MKNKELIALKNSNYLEHGFPKVLEKVKEVIDEFIVKLILLHDFDKDIIDENIRECTIKLNEVGFTGYQCIEDVERHSIIKAFDKIEEIIGHPDIWDIVEEERDF